MLCLAVVVKLTSSYIESTDLISLASETPHRSQADGSAVLATMTEGRTGPGLADSWAHFIH